MTPLDYLPYLKGGYSFRALFFIIVFVQIFSSSLITAQFHLIQHDSSNELTVIKSFPVTTITSCVLECSSSLTQCHKSEIETTPDNQKICHFLQKETPAELQKLFDELSQGTPEISTQNNNSASTYHGFFVSPLINSCTFQREGCPSFKGWVLQKKNLCYDVTQSTPKTGYFKAVQEGRVSQVALVHVSGFVHARSTWLKAYWGAVHPSDNCAEDRCYSTIILNAARDLIFPHNIAMNQYSSYNLNGFSEAKSKYIILPRGSNPYMVERGDEFQVMVGLQKLIDSYYAGIHCVNVYFYYD